MGLSGHTPRRVLRLALRAPILAYRAGLGWMFGYRLIYLAHRGRASGLRRDVVLEVVRYDSVSGEVVVVSGWGKRAQWYRNLRASPALEVRIGRHRYVAPEQRFLNEDETAALLEARQLPAVAFRPSTGDAL